MTEENKPAFLHHFDELKDPRVERTKLYPLDEILLVMLTASICGIRSWRNLVSFGKKNIEYFRRFFPFKNGIPSKNTFSRVMSMLDPVAFKKCFIAWTNSFQIAAKSVMAIDGKTLRNSIDKATEQKATHMVSAFATEARLVLAQEKVADKSNEISAIPKLLDVLSISEATVTIDAMGTQKEIAAKIREKNANYILALKGNHKTLHNDVTQFFPVKLRNITKNNRTK